MMKNLSVVSFIEEEKVVELKASLINDCYTIFELDGKIIVDEKTFFKCVANVLPQDPPLSGNINYDAFVDSIWGGLDALGKEKVAILWTNVEKFSIQDIKGMKMIIRCLNDIANSISTNEFGIEKPITLHVYVSGVNDKSLIDSMSKCQAQHLSTY
jgi:hypothetical protein